VNALLREGYLPSYVQVPDNENPFAFTLQ